jgi:2-hydroxychromene-2-carboxylate isomerase
MFPAREGLQTVVTRTFAITYDYRCPYARIAHDHVIAGLRGGADWDVTFLPFSLGQVHVAEGEPPVWERPEVDSGLLALQVSVAVRDDQPAHFLDVHHALFEHRHAVAGQLRTRDDLTPVLRPTGVDVDRVWAEVDSRRPLATVEKEHTGYADSHSVWGVPTFVVGDRAVFVRLLTLPGDDSELATRTVERVLDQVEWPILNEFKHTSIPR